MENEGLKDKLKSFEKYINKLEAEIDKYDNNK